MRSPLRRPAKPHEADHRNNQAAIGVQAHNARVVLSQQQSGDERTHLKKALMALVDPERSLAAAKALFKRAIGEPFAASAAIGIARTLIATSGKSEPGKRARDQEADPACLHRNRHSVQSRFGTL